MENTTNQPQQWKFIPLSRWDQYHDWPTVSALRWLVFHAKTNGLESAIRRVGRRVLIDETEFFNWVDRNGKGAQ